jgi:cupin fold WbuC family metalloprotein
MPPLTVIDLALCRQLSRRAADSPRRRQNLNLHTELAAPSQRMLNALEPGTYVRPHRHTTPLRAETFLALQGQLALCQFGDGGELEQVVVLGPGTGVFGVDVAPGVWHSVICLQPGTVFFEAKDGPYRPIDDKDWPDWAPVEGSAQVRDYLLALQTRIRDWLEGKG